MNNYLAVWSFALYDGRGQEITLAFWANTETDARWIARAWFDRAEPTRTPCDFTITNLSEERA